MTPNTVINSSNWERNNNIVITTSKLNMYHTLPNGLGVRDRIEKQSYTFMARKKTDVDCTKSHKKVYVDGSFHGKNQLTSISMYKTRKIRILK